jgi:Second Messenger Oligonucleotide or Dinucleotide Synthetase domain/Adenylyl/Guanylyl and SMODS C-terminal sensor domain
MSEWVKQRASFGSFGSAAHLRLDGARLLGAIIKPVDQGEFDADLLVFVEPVEGWNSEEYIDTLLDVFKANGTYKDKMKRWSHCVTITYANDKKVDIAPCIVNRGGFARLEVCNHNTNQFERSEPRRYTDWLIERNDYSGSNSFRKVTRLIKYLRDIKTRFTCTSVLLTTILGHQISAADKNTDAFADTPTALRTVFARMDDWLQVNLVKPSVINPFLPSEDLTDAWTDEQYANFREKIHTYREWIDEAYDEQDRSESIGKWRRIFGDDFARGVAFDEGRRVTKSAVNLLKSTVSTAALFTGDLVDAVRQFGARAIPARIYRLPYMDRPTWRHAAQVMPVCVTADLHQSEGGSFVKRVEGLDQLPPGYWLHFRTSTGTGLPFNTNDYRVEWRVTNTDEAAYNANCLRGHFYKSKSDNSRWEELKYRGVHLVEAFVIRKRDERLVGASEPFRVVIR